MCIYSIDDEPINTYLYNINIYIYVYIIYILICSFVPLTEFIAFMLFVSFCATQVI